VPNVTCRCGYRSAADDDLAAHLSEALVPDDDLTAGGVIHAECPSATASKACLCGLRATDPAALAGRPGEGARLSWPPCAMRPG